MTSLPEGEYAVWQISGHVQIRFTRVAGSHAIASALLIGAPSGSPAAASASFVRADTTTKGNWKGVYGSAGHVLAGETAAPPSWATVTQPATTTWTYTASTTDPRALQRPASNDRFAVIWYNASTFMFDVNITGSTARDVALHMIDYDHYSRAQRVDVIDPSTGAVLDSRNVSNFTDGQYLVWQIKGRVQIRITLTGAMNAVASGLFFGTGGTPPGPTASFVREDNSTAGSWKGVYGGAGHVMYGEAAAPPSWATVTPPAASTWTFASSTTDPRALQRPASNDRFAAVWHSTGTFSFDVNITDGAPHEVALYMVDYDHYSRAQRVEVVNAATNAVLDTRTVGSFGGGRWLVWQITGRVLIRITYVGGINAVASGIFFGGGGVSSSNATASFVREDTATAGSWKGVYGSAGHVMYGEAAVPPSWATVTPPAAETWTFATSTSDPRALQRPASSDRFAATWHSTSPYSFDVNVTGGVARQVALYMVDYDHYSRSQRVEVVDATTGTVLDTRTVTSFGGGRWLVWQVNGRVLIRITHMGGINAVANGLFFGP
jgi:hypothetical protein